MNNLPQYHKDFLSPTAPGMFTESNPQPTYPASLNLLAKKDEEEDTTYTMGRSRGNYEKSGKARDLLSGQGGITFDKDGKLDGVSGKAGIGTDKLGGEVGGAYDHKTGGVSGNINANAGVAEFGLNFDSEKKSAGVNVGVDTSILGGNITIGGSTDTGLETTISGNVLGAGVSRTTNSKGPTPNTTTDTITIKAGPEKYAQSVTTYDRVLADKGHPQYTPNKETPLKTTLTETVTVMGKVVVDKVTVETPLPNGKMSTKVTKDYKSPEFKASRQNINEVFNSAVSSINSAQAYQNQISNNLHNHMVSTYGPMAPSPGFIDRTVQAAIQIGNYGTDLRDVEKSDIVAQAFETAIKGELERETEARVEKGYTTPLKSHNIASYAAAVKKEMQAVPTAVARRQEVLKAAREKNLDKIHDYIKQKTVFMSPKDMKTEYDTLMGELMAKGISQGLLEEIARGNQAQAQKSGKAQTPNLGAAIMLGLKGQSLVGRATKGQFTPFELTANERAYNSRSKGSQQAAQDAIDGIRETENYQGPSRENTAKDDNPFSRADIDKATSAARQGVATSVVNGLTGETIFDGSARQSKTSPDKSRDMAAPTKPDGPTAQDWAAVQNNIDRDQAQQSQQQQATQKTQTANTKTQAEKVPDAPLDLTAAQPKSDKLGESAAPQAKNGLNANPLDNPDLVGNSEEAKEQLKAKAAKNVRESQSAEDSGNENHGSGNNKNENLYGDKNTPGSLGTAGSYDSQGNYQSGTDAFGNSTGGVRTDKHGREIGAWGQFTRDIVGRGDGSASAGNTRVICTELVHQGLMDAKLQRLDIAFTLRHLSPATVRGYHFWAVPYVQLMKSSRFVTRIIEPFARWRAEEIAFQMGVAPKPNYKGKIVRLIGEPICWIVGTVLGWTGAPDCFYPQQHT